MKYEYLKNKISEFFDCYRKQITVLQLMKKLDIDKDDINLVLDCLFEIEKEGKILYVGNTTYLYVPKDFVYKSGVLSKSNSNNYYVSLGNGERILIKNIRNAHVGEVVFVTKNKGNHPKSYVGDIVRRVKRESIFKSDNYIIRGVLRKDGNHFYILNNDNRIYVPKEKLNTAFVGDTVNVHVHDNIGHVIEVLKRHQDIHVFECVNVNGNLKWVPMATSYGYFEFQNNKFHEGDRIIAKVVGNQLVLVKKLETVYSVANDVNALVLDFGFSHEFPNQVLDEARKLSSERVSLDDDRVDLRNLETFTIDPVDAKDLDDAISLIYEDGIYHLYVHAANPSHYIDLNSPIFKEAFRRAFSVYPTTEVIPMLPSAFSSGVCSLNEDGDKYAITCRLDIDEEGNLINFDVFRSVIHSDKQMNYDAVNAFFENNDSVPEYLKFRDTLFMMRKLAFILDKKKMERGAITIDSDEKKFVLDSEKNPIGIVEAQNGEAQLMIENFMLLANERVTEYARDLGLPFYFRNHDKPTVQKGTNLKQNLIQKGYLVRKIGNIENPEILQKFLANLLKGKNKDERKAICELVLRSMSRAYYDYVNIGHYGLALECYGTITSPARKITDLVNHMVLEDFLINQDVDSNKIKDCREFIQESCEYISNKQRDADLLEQEINELMLCKFSDNFIGQEVKARILFINQDGVYVRDDHGLTGVIPLSKRIGINHNTVNINDNHYSVGDNISVILKKRDGNNLIFDFNPLKVKKLVKVR